MHFPSLAKWVLIFSDGTFLVSINCNLVRHLPSCREVDCGFKSSLKGRMLAKLFAYVLQIPSILIHLIPPVK